MNNKFKPKSKENSGLANVAKAVKRPARRLSVGLGLGLVNTLSVGLGLELVNTLSVGLGLGLANTLSVGLGLGLVNTLSVGLGLGLSTPSVWTSVSEVGHCMQQGV